MIGNTTDPSLLKIDDRAYNIAIAEGKVPGTSLARIIGFMDNAGTTENDIWSSGTTKIFPTTATGATIVSTDAADTLAGIGAQTGIIRGLDQNFDFVRAPFDFNGVAGTTTTQLFIRVHEVEVLTSGNANREIPNLGLIDIDVDGNLQAQIPINAGITNMSHFTVPRNMIGFLKQFRIRAETEDTTIRIKVARETGPFVNREPISISTETIEEEIDGFALLPPKSDIKATAQLPGGPSTRQVEVEYKMILKRYEDEELNRILKLP